MEQDGYIDAGIQLKVTPTVNTDSNITLSIEAVLSRVIDQISPSGAVAFPAPVLSERRIETEFSLMSDRTIAIGGLIQTTEEEAITKIRLPKPKRRTKQLRPKSRSPLPKKKIPKTAKKKSIASSTTSTPSKEASIPGESVSRGLP